MKPVRDCRKGFTLVEIAIVLGIFALIMAGIWMVVAVVGENTRSYEASRQLQAMVQGIRQIEQRITGYTPTSIGNAITDRLDSQGAFPPEMRMQASVTNNLNHPWAGDGNAVHVFARSPSEFGIQFTKLPKKACITLATKMSGSELSGLQSLNVNGNVTNITNLPLTLISATSRCTQNDSTNTIEWRFNLRGGS
jgi:prepilin-type N-terminal cleavage/methylation domain-containing protein